LNKEALLDWCREPLQPGRKPLIMGVLNVTPDSFSDGGSYHVLENAQKHALKMIEQGADIIDIGGESTKPGVKLVSLEEELSRLLPIIKFFKNESDICISIDTNKPEVMQAAVEAGAGMINDIFALQKEGALEIAAKLEVPICLMHMQGIPENMQNNPNYPQGIMSHMVQFFRERLLACKKAGIALDRLILDPGFGFGKTVADNMLCMKHLEDLHNFQRPVLLGVSRKSTIGALLNKEVQERLIGSIALEVYAACKGVSIIRTHDVDALNQALVIINHISR
jgi:dihydropteroate synthase